MSDQQKLHKLKHKEEENIIGLGKEFVRGFPQPEWIFWPTQINPLGIYPRELETHVHTNASPTSIQNHPKWFLICEWKNKVCHLLSSQNNWKTHYGNNTDDFPIYLPMKATRLWRSHSLRL